MKRWRLLLRPASTWFFREARPADSTTLAASHLLPPVRTLMGALRTLTGESLGVDWRAFARRDGRAHARASDIDLVKLMGDAQTFGELCVRGPWVNLNGRRLVPAPDVFQLRRWHGRPAGENSLIEVGLMSIKLVRNVTASAGTVAIANPERERGFERPDGLWMDADALGKWLAAPSHRVEKEWFHLLPDLVFEEPVTGIAIDPATRSAEDGKIYQVRQLRLAAGVQVELEVQGLPAGVLPPSGVIRLGADGRITDYAIVELAAAASAAETAAPAPALQLQAVVVFLTPASFGANGHGAAWPAGTCKIDGGWKVPLRGQEVTVLARRGPKPLREGGWDMKERSPRPAQALVPAGTVWFCEDDAAFRAARAGAPDLLASGVDASLGRGEIALGWIMI